MLSSVVQDERIRNRSQHTYACTHFPESHTIRSSGLPSMRHDFQIQLLIYILSYSVTGLSIFQLFTKQGFITSRALVSNVKNNRSGKHWSGLAPRLQRLHLGVLLDSPKTFCLWDGENCAIVGVWYKEEELWEIWDQWGSARSTVSPPTAVSVMVFSPAGNTWIPPTAPLLLEVDIKHLFRCLSSLQHPLCCDLKVSSKDKAVWLVCLLNQSVS